MSVSGGERLGSNGYAVASNLDPTLLPVSTLRPLGREARKHPPAQVRKLAESLDRFGFVLPILADRENRVVAGWGLVLAARKLGIPDVPVVTVADLEETDLRLLRLALNVRFTLPTSVVVSCHVPARSVSAWTFSTTRSMLFFDGR